MWRRDVIRIQFGQPSRRRRIKEGGVGAMKIATSLLQMGFILLLLYATQAPASAQSPPPERQLFLPIIGLESRQPIAETPDAPSGNQEDGDDGDGASTSPVIITEFMASDSEALDWIELYNRSEDDVDLGGWYLTDDGENLTKWQFPPKTLAAGAYLIVFASDRDQVESQLHTNFKLKREGEYLALIQPDGRTLAWGYEPDYPPQFEGVSYGLDVALNPLYLSIATPARANDLEPTNAAPIVSQASHWPTLLAAETDWVVTATVRASASPIRQVMLHYRVMFGETHALPMQDDGGHHDLLADDGIFGAEIPSSAYQPGEMVRYYVTAEDVDGQLMRWPILGHSAKQPEYFGTMVANPSLSSNLPILHWFVEDTTAAETRDGTRASLFYDGHFYDNFFVRTRGTANDFYDLKSFKFDFNKDHYFRLAEDETLGIPADLKPMDEINLNRTVIDRSYIRQLLSWETYRDVGTPYCLSFGVQLYQNNVFHGVPIWVEQPDERYLKRNGLDPRGAFYKMYNRLQTASYGYNKQTRVEEDNSDLAALVDGVDPLNSGRTAYLFDHINLPAVVNYLAATVVMMEYDHISSNYYLYRDTEGTGEWMMVPWDKDLTFGHTPERDADHPIYGHPFFGDSAHVQFEIEDRWNRLYEAIYHTPETREMYLRRLRTVMDEFLQSPDTPTAELRYERRIDELVALMRADVALDAPQWEFPPDFIGLTESIKTDYLAVRREHLYNTLGPGGEGLIPAAQPENAMVTFGPMDAAPLSGNVDEAYFTLVNPNAYAVDISGWRVEGDVTIQFQPGVVIPAGGTLYVAADVVAFRNRATSPTGGEMHFVQGNYSGMLLGANGELQLVDGNG